MQFDNDRELAGWGPAARTLSRVIRLCLRFGASPVFIPAGEPQLGGRVENFNGWFQDPLLDRRFRRPGDLRRELSRLQEAVNAACPPTSGWQDTGAAPPGPVPAEAAREFPRADGATAAVRGPRDPHPAGQWSRGGHGAESDVPGGEEASGLVPAAGGGHRTRASDVVPERPCADALALQAAERLTDIEPRGRCRFPPTVRAVMR